MCVINVALFGCGTVGGGLWQILQEERERIIRRFGVEVNVAGVCVRDIEKERAADLPRTLLTDDPSVLLSDPSINVSIEMIGGEREALDVVTLALEAGHHIITANKLIVARHLPALRRLERGFGGTLRYGAAVCGSIPVLKIIDETLTVDRITAIRGVVNGSTNFILSRMAEGVSRADALALAERSGFLEADPRADLSGADAAQKLSILAAHAFGVHLPPERIATCGIEEITDLDIARATSRGETIKLVAEARIDSEGTVVLEVAPRVLALTDPLAQVQNEINIVELECERAGVQRYTGPGAGSLPTANAVVTDLLDLVASDYSSAGRGLLVEQLRPWSALIAA